MPVIMRQPSSGYPYPLLDLIDEADLMAAEALLDARYGLGVEEGEWTVLYPIEASPNSSPRASPGASPGASPESIARSPTRLLDVSFWIEVLCGDRLVGVDLYKQFMDGSWHVGKVVSLSAGSKISVDGVRSRFSYAVVSARVGTLDLKLDSKLGLRCALLPGLKGLGLTLIFRTFQVFDDGSTQAAHVDKIMYHSWLFNATVGLAPIRVVVGDTESCETEGVFREDMERVFAVNPAGTVVHFRDMDEYSPVSMSVAYELYDGSLMVGLCIGREVERRRVRATGKLFWVFLYTVVFDDGVVRLLTLSEMADGVQLFQAFQAARRDVRAIKVIF